MPTPEIDAQVDSALREDLGSGDVTAALIPVNASARARVIVREQAVLCGTDWFDAVFARLDPGIQIEWRERDGASLGPDDTVCLLRGPARGILSGERTALNFLQTLSATATLSRRYADAVSGTGCRILDTRKTLPGLRSAQKYAVRTGGCSNHRFGLYDAILIKENHIAAAGGLTRAIDAAHAHPDRVPVEVEVENLVDLQRALQAGARRIMLDNFPLTALREAVALNRARPAGQQAELEASGGITLGNVREIAASGVNYISVGALTKDVRAVDLSMRFQLELP